MIDPIFFARRCDCLGIVIDWVSAGTLISFRIDSACWNDDALNEEYVRMIGSCVFYIMWNAAHG